MRDTLNRLLTSFCKNNAASFTLSDEPEAQAELQFDGFTVQLSAQENTLRFRTMIALLPQQKREELCLALLKGNNLLQESRCYSLSLDQSGESVQLHIDWPADKLDDASFGNLILNLLTVAQEWMLKLDEVRHTEKKEEETFDASAQMLRI